MSSTNPSCADTASLPKLPVTDKKHLEPGASVGRYIVVDRVGEGGMGVVYKAYDPQLGRTVALKLLVAHGASRSGGTFRDRLLREARALALLSHPNVIHVHDAGTFGEDVFLTMEFVEGPTLREWLATARRTRKQILETFLAAGEGLVAAHAAGLVHRDFKPDNAIVATDGRVRVLDFGLARAADVTDEELPATEEKLGEPRAAAAEPPSAHHPESRGEGPSPSHEKNTTGSSRRNAPAHSLSSLTEADAVMGTPRFMAPEQHLGETVDERADQFSFCVALYTALYGSAPFAGDKQWELAATVLAGKVADPPPGSSVPRWLRLVLLRGLAIEAGDRFPSMAALLAALRADPSLARGRWLRIGAMAAVLAASGAAWVASNRRQERACQGAERALEGIWDDDRRALVRDAFGASKLPYAPLVLRTVERRLDDYAGVWVRMHVDACEATRVRGDQSQELLDLRMACLDDRLAEMKGMTDVFARADAKVVERAVESAESLPSLAGCADAAALRAPIPPPRDPAAMKRVAELRAQMAQGSALHLTGDYDGGTQMAERALVGAEALHYPPIEAEAAYLVGKLRADYGDFGGAARAYHRSLVAATAGRDDTSAAKATIALVHADGVMHSRFEEADRWADLAEASVGRLKEKEDLLGSLYEERSVLRRRESKLEEALADAKRALEVHLRLYGPRNDRVGVTYHFLGNAYWALAKYPEALDAYSHAIEIFVAEVGPDHPKLAATLIGMGNVHGDMDDPEAALADFHRALALLERFTPGDPDIGAIYNNIGDVLEGMGKLEEARAQYQRAFERREKDLGPSFELTMTLDNLGEVSLELEDSAAAMGYFTQALDMGEKVLGPDHALCAGALWGIGESYRLEGKLDDAWGYFQRSLPVAEKALGASHPMLARPLLLGIGQVQLARGETAAAIATLERAEKLAEGRGRPRDVAAIRAVLAKAVARRGGGR
jgi:serine/threonine protein kinase